MKNEYEDKYGMTKDIIKYADADILPPFRIDRTKVALGVRKEVN